MNTTPETITRLAFLKQLGLSGSALVAFYCASTLTSCSKSSSDPTPATPAAVLAEKY